VGEEARVRLDTFSLADAESHRWREQLRTMEEERLALEVVAVGNVGRLLPELEPVVKAWEEAHGGADGGFARGSFRPVYLERVPLALVRRGGAPVAFAALWLGAGREELSADLVRHLPDAPAGILEFVLVRLMEWGSARGYRWFDLGLTPGAGGLAPPLVGEILGQAGFRYGEHFPNLRQLREFKERFGPIWQSSRMAAPGGFALARILSDLAALATSDGRNGR
jgi:phosphatidylglycerol lysyltransferase